MRFNSTQGINECAHSSEGKNVTKNVTKKGI